MIYLDNAATTPILEPPGIVDNAINLFANPSSLHKEGRKAAQALEKARKRVADCINAEPEEIIFTSGGTEANNLALRGIVPYLKKINKTTIVTSCIEHHSVLNTCKDLETQGIEVVYLNVTPTGRINMTSFYSAIINNKVGLVSIMSVNNEIGTIQDIDYISNLCKENNIIFMTDAVQAITHIPIDVKKSNIALMSMSAHKINSHKGVGVLYVRRDIELSPILTGGNQENGLRSGTENFQGILHFSNMFKFLNGKIDRNEDFYGYWKELFIKALDKLKVDFKINSNDKLSVSNIISLTLPGCSNEAMVLLLSDRGIYVSAGAACSSNSIEPSHVLKAIGLSDEDALCTIRISTGNNSFVDAITSAHAIAECSQILLSMNEGEVINTEYEQDNGD